MASQETSEIGPEELPKPMNKGITHSHTYAHGYCLSYFSRSLAEIVYFITLTLLLKENLRLLEASIGVIS